MILDSGANETMFNNFSIARELNTQQTDIHTAGKGMTVQKGNFGTARDLFFQSLREELVPPYAVSFQIK